MIMATTTTTTTINQLERVNITAYKEMIIMIWSGERNIYIYIAMDDKIVFFFDFFNR